MAEKYICHSGYLGNIFSCADNNSTLQNVNSCIRYYSSILNTSSGCVEYSPPPPPTECEIYSSSGGGEPYFDWALANQGFKDSFFLFLTMFAVYCIVKILHLPLK